MIKEEHTAIESIAKNAVRIHWLERGVQYAWEIAIADVAKRLTRSSNYLRGSKKKGEIWSNCFSNCLFIYLLTRVNIQLDNNKENGRLKMLAGD
jgi:hypothetical protein